MRGLRHLVGVSQFQSIRDGLLDAFSTTLRNLDALAGLLLTESAMVRKANQLTTERGGSSLIRELSRN